MTVVIPQHTRLGQARFYKGGKLTPWAKAPVPEPIPLGSRGDPVIPLIGSSVPGPMELYHLPRMWLEGILGATERLHPDFRAGRPLFDELVCDRIGIDRAAFREFLRTPPLPDYLACERWVRENATQLDVASIVQTNNAIRKAMDRGIPIVMLDDVRAWDALHAYLIAHRGEPIDPIVPSLSSKVCGALGVDHLPRIWVKNILKTSGALPLGYRAGFHRIVRKGLAYVAAGLDSVTCQDIGLSMRASVDFLDANQPDYPTYEAWVESNATQLDAATLAYHNSIRSDTRALKAYSEKVYAGFEDETNFSYTIDDLIDWKLIFDTVTGAPIPAWSGP